MGVGGEWGRMVGLDMGGEGGLGGLIGLHTRPLPVKPALQVHSKLPGVLVQRASLWQLSLPCAHSLISVNISNILTCITQLFLIIKWSG